MSDSLNPPQLTALWRAALKDIAGAIATGRDHYTIDLSPIWPPNIYTDWFMNAVTQNLTYQVEAQSLSQMTVRPVSHEHFLRRPDRDDIALVVCPMKTPPGEVAELARDMRLVRISPKDNLFSIDADQATDAVVKERRAELAKMAARNAVVKGAKDDIGKLVEILARYVLTMAKAFSKKEVRQEAQQFLGHIHNPQAEHLVHIGIIVKLMGQDFDEVVHQALTQEMASRIPTAAEAGA
jgi:hypothetical protein